MRKYIKPEINFERTVLKKDIANTCWGYHDNSGVHGEDLNNQYPDKMYCDIPGTGFVGFNITDKKCNFSDNTISWTYYEWDEHKNKVAKKAPTGTYQTFKGIIEAAGGNKGQPFDGEGIIVIPDDPKPSWS